MKSAEVSRGDSQHIRQRASLGDVVNVSRDGLLERMSGRTLRMRICTPPAVPILQRANRALIRSSLHRLRESTSVVRVLPIARSMRMAHAETTPCERERGA